MPVKAPDDTTVERVLAWLSRRGSRLFLPLIEQGHARLARCQPHGRLAKIDTSRIKGHT